MCTLINCILTCSELYIFFLKMAFAQSLPKGQIPVCCKLCLTDTKISWKCQECDVLMCNRCKETIHPNIKNAKNHKVTDIKDVGLLSDKMDASTTKCKHKGQVFVMYCKSCDQLVCPLCIAEIHNGHELVEISEGYQIHIERLKQEQSQMKSLLYVLTKQGTKIEEIKKAEKCKYMEAQKKIQAHNKALKKTVDQHTDKLMKELDKKWETLRRSFEMEESRVVTLKQNKKEKNQQVDKILISNDGEKIFEESKKLEKYLKEEFPDVDFESMPDFQPGEISQYNVGSLQNISTDIAIKVKKEFKTDIPHIFFMSSCVDSLWIGNNGVVEKVQLEENNLKVMSRLEMVHVNGIAVTPSNDLLLASGEQMLKMISGSTGEMTDSVYSVDPLYPTTVHVTSDYKIIVGAKSSPKEFPVTGRRVVFLMDKEAKHKTIFEYDRNNQSIFTLPMRIVSTYNGNICVVDRLTSDVRGRVVVIGQDGYVLNIYNGHPDINIEGMPFKPVSIETTPSGNIIVPEKQTHVLHILNNLGYPMTHIKVDDLGIYYPYSIAFTITGKQYIGCSRQGDSSDKFFRLFEVEIMGC